MEMTGKIWIEKVVLYKMIRKSIENEFNLGRIPQNAEMHISMSGREENVQVTFRWEAKNEI